ncbi:hypothetical protein CV093_15620 [Oceanobacillus sp. 143]|nr:hypothetical protein CV093_15620 [Oceanobacillus sp. 143]
MGGNSVPNKKCRKKPPEKEKVPQNVRDKIAAKNHLDIELYKYARKQFEEKIQALDAKTLQEMDAFKKSLSKM